MNNVQICYDVTGKLDPNVMLTISENSEAVFKEHIFPFMEIELLQGDRHELGDGLIMYQFDLSNEKALILKQALYSVLVLANQLN